PYPPSASSALASSRSSGAKRLGRARPSNDASPCLRRVPRAERARVLMEVSRRGELGAIIVGDRQATEPQFVQTCAKPRQCPPRQTGSYLHGQGFLRDSARPNDTRTGKST